RSNPQPSSLDLIPRSLQLASITRKSVSRAAAAKSVQSSMFAIHQPGVQTDGEIHVKSLQKQVKDLVEMDEIHEATKNVYQEKIDEKDKAIEALRAENEEFKAKSDSRMDITTRKDKEIAKLNAIERIKAMWKKLQSQWRSSATSISRLPILQHPRHSHLMLKSSSRVFRKLHHTYDDWIAASEVQAKEAEELRLIINGKPSPQIS
ncbi:MAG: hypothetical protein Q9180_007924, partial [Flavoplaca navasiana]